MNAQPTCETCFYLRQRFADMYTGKVHCNNIAERKERTGCDSYMYVERTDPACKRYRNDQKERQRRRKRGRK